MLQARQEGRIWNGLSFLARCFENAVRMELLSSWLIPRVSRVSVDIVYVGCVGSSKPGWEGVQGESSCSYTVSPPETGQQRRGPVVLFAPSMNKIPKGTRGVASPFQNHLCPTGDNPTWVVPWG